LSVGTQISMKVPVCGGDFLLRIIKRLIHTTSERRRLEGKCKTVIKTQKRDGDIRFYVKPQIEKNNGEKEEENPL